MTDDPAPTPPERKTRVFICYKQEDPADPRFADRLFGALESRGFDPKMDRPRDKAGLAAIHSGIGPGETWDAEVDRMIREADTVVFVISPDSVESVECKREVALAAKLNKRILGIVLRTVDSARLVPEGVSAPNWIYFNESERFEASMEVLALALEKAIGWIRKHTEFSELARRWDIAKRPGAEGLMLRPPLLTDAEEWLRTHRPGWPLPTDATRIYISESRIAFRQEMRRKRVVGTTLFLLFAGIFIGLAAWANESTIIEYWHWQTATRPFMRDHVRPYVLTAAAERALSAGQSFRECVTLRDTDYCPTMIAISAGSFFMGSSAVPSASPEELPQHRVSIARRIAVSKFPVTFDEWDTCAQFGDCNAQIGDSGTGRGDRPVINVTWYDAQQYVLWWSRMTGKHYRLLTEAEYEYAARAGTQTIYPWGDVIGVANANCAGCGSRWDNIETAPVGSFPPNRFGLYDMVGNVWEWVEDCFHDSYTDAPSDGSAWLKGGNCDSRMIRGGSWRGVPDTVRSSNRDPSPADRPGFSLGFRVARILE